MKKSLLLLAALLGFATSSHAAVVRYVQISTNTLTRQTGTAVVAGINASTATISSATITAATIPTLTVTTATITSATVTASTITTLTAPAIDGVTTLKGSSGAMTGWSTIATSSITPTHIIGTTTNDNATVGSYGEYISSSANAVNFPGTGTFGDLASIILTAGDWDISLVFEGDRNTTPAASFTSVTYGIGTAPGTGTTGLVDGDTKIQIVFAGGMTTVGGSIAGYRKSLSGTTTIYAKMRADYASGQAQAYGRISARRIR